MRRFLKTGTDSWNGTIALRGLIYCVITWWESELREETTNKSVSFYTVYCKCVFGPGVLQFYGSHKRELASPLFRPMFRQVFISRRNSAASRDFTMLSLYNALPLCGRATVLLVALQHVQFRFSDPNITVSTENLSLLFLAQKWKGRWKNCPLDVWKIHLKIKIHTNNKVTLKR